MALTIHRVASSALWPMALFASCSAAIGCAPPPVQVLPNQEFLGTDGREHPLIDKDANFQVIELFSTHCKCQEKHDARLKAMVHEFEMRGVKWVAVDSEVGASIERDRPEAERRGYPFPILLDPHGTVAKLFGAEYATFSILTTPEGQILYRGGIDSDMHNLTPTPTQHLKNAILDALDEHPIREPFARTLGCALNLE